PSNDREQSLERGRTQGLMAVDMLGRSWFDTCAQTTSDRFADVHGQLARLGDDPNWPETLHDIGAAGRNCCPRMPSAIDQWTSEALTAPDPRCRTLLAAADRLWRQLDGTLSLTNKSIAPSLIFRQLMLSSLLLWQGERTLADHWYSEDPALAPYFKTAGL